MVCLLPFRLRCATEVISWSVKIKPFLKHNLHKLSKGGLLLKDGLNSIQQGRGSSRTPGIKGCRDTDGDPRWRLWGDPKECGQYLSDFRFSGPWASSWFWELRRSNPLRRSRPLRRSLWRIGICFRRRSKIFRRPPKSAVTSVCGVLSSLDDLVSSTIRSPSMMGG